MCIRDSLIGAGDQVLEADGVGGVAGDGALNVLLLHDGNALHDIVSAVALDGCALTLGEGDLLDDLQGLGGDVVLGLHIGEAVDTGNDVSCVLAPVSYTHLDVYKRQPAIAWWRSA